MCHDVEGPSLGYDLAVHLCLFDTGFREARWIVVNRNSHMIHTSRRTMARSATGGAGRSRRYDEEVQAIQVVNDSVQVLSAGDDVLLHEARLLPCQWSFILGRYNLNQAKMIWVDTGSDICFAPHQQLIDDSKHIYRSTFSPSESVSLFGLKSLCWKSVHMKCHFIFKLKKKNRLRRKFDFDFPLSSYFCQNLTRGTGLL